MQNDQREHFEKYVHAMEYRLETLYSILEEVGMEESAQLNPQELHLPGSYTLFGGNLNGILGKIHYRISPGSSEERLLRSIFNRSIDPLLFISKDGAFLWANDLMCELLETDISGLREKNFYDSLSRDYHELIHSRFSRQNLDVPPASSRDVEDIFVFQMLSMGGHVRNVEGCFVPFYYGQQTGFAVAVRDIMDSQELNNELKRSREHYTALSETVKEVILRIDEDLFIRYVNTAAGQMFGYASDELIGRPLDCLFPNEVIQRHAGELRKAFYIDTDHREILGMKSSLEMLAQRRDRSVFPIEISFGNTRDFEPRTLTCIIRDITPQKNAERRLHLLAYFDNLTSLGNRDLFGEEIDEYFASIAEKFQLGAVLYLDLDGFKRVNDSLGHGSGDNLLVQVARRLHDCLRASDSVYRFGGDEFLVLLRNIKQQDDAAIVARNILNTIRMPFFIRVDGERTQVANIGVSIGIHLISSADMKKDQLIQHADLAMYAAKSGGKNTFMFYSPKMLDTVHRKWNIEQGLKQALEKNQFCVFYQPIVDEKRRIQAFEALIRWRHPDLGLLEPADFLPMAEESGLIVPMGVWVLKKACDDLKRWINLGFPDMKVSVNFNTRQFDQNDLVEVLTGILHSSGCDPRNVLIELTETGIMKNPQESIRKMRTLKEVFPNIQILVDDFGTGYSSLNYLASLPADALKVDLTFVSNLSLPNNEKVVQAIVQLAQSLELGYVVEGIETKPQLEFFQKLGCTRMQGFYFSRPVDVHRVDDMLLRGQAMLYGA